MGGGDDDRRGRERRRSEAKAFEGVMVDIVLAGDAKLLRCDRTRRLEVTRCTCCREDEGRLVRYVWRDLKFEVRTTYGKAGQVSCRDCV